MPEMKTHRNYNVVRILAALSILMPFSLRLHQIDPCIPSRTSSGGGAASTQAARRRGACRDNYPAAGGRTVAARVAGLEFDVYVHGGEGIGDIVSNTLAKTGAWEKLETEMLLGLFPCKDEAKNNLGPAARPDEECPGGLGGRRGVLLDVGANIGWFSIVASRLGHSVISFEPFVRNVDLICASASTIPPSFKDRFIVHQMGLDYRHRECELLQNPSANFGDTMSICDPDSRSKFHARGFERLGWMNTTTLDDALMEGYFDGVEGQIDVMKIDCEGFEPNVFAGGNRFFGSKKAPRYVFVEMASNIMGWALDPTSRGWGKRDQGSMKRSDDLFRTVLFHLANHGYDLAEFSKRGNKNVSLSSSSFEEVQKLVDGDTILLVKT